jgi:hypothetical protein
MGSPCLDRDPRPFRIRTRIPPSYVERVGDGDGDAGRGARLRRRAVATCAHSGRFWMTNAPPCKPGLGASRGRADAGSQTALLKRRKTWSPRHARPTRFSRRWRQVLLLFLKPRRRTQLCARAVTRHLSGRSAEGGVSAPRRGQQVRARLPEYTARARAVVERAKTRARAFL